MPSLATRNATRLLTSSSLPPGWRAFGSWRRCHRHLRPLPEAPPFSHACRVLRHDELHGYRRAMTKALVVQLAPTVWRIPLVRDFVNGFILRDDDGQVTLVDMGVRSSGPKVMAALGLIGSAPSDVTRLLLTHAHPDHAGGAAHVARETGRSFTLHHDDAAYAREGSSPPRDRSFLLG